MPFISFIFISSPLFCITYLKLQGLKPLALGNAAYSKGPVGELHTYKHVQRTVCREALPLSGGQASKTACKISINILTNKFILWFNGWCGAS
jgi:hypothetical protein